MVLRLPYELKELFRDWLEQHYPLRAAHVMSIVQQMRGGRDNDSRWGVRMTGEGIFARLIQERFDKACVRLRLNLRQYQLRTDLFVPPRAVAGGTGRVAATPSATPNPVPTLALIRLPAQLGLFD